MMFVTGSSPNRHNGPDSGEAPTVHESNWFDYPLTRDVEVKVPSCNSR